MSEWITDRFPENNRDVLVSPSYEEGARIGFFVESKDSRGRISRSWYVWEGDDRVPYGPAYIDGWMLLPKTVFTLAQEEGK